MLQIVARTAIECPRAGGRERERERQREREKDRERVSERYIRGSCN